MSWGGSITRASLLLVCLSLAPAAVRAQVPETPSRETRVDRLFARWNKPDTPGCAVAVVRDGRVVYQRGFGCANLEHGIPITPASVFQIASVSKQFTAFAAILLAQEGKLSLDEPVRRYLPDLPAWGDRITPRHLIHHTSGLRDQFDLLELAGRRMSDVITDEDVLSLIRRQQDLNFEPGAEYLYSNSGYTLLSALVKQVSGKPFSQFCAERIFQPLGMTSTHVQDDYRKVVRNRATSYAPRAGGFAQSVLTYANTGASSVHTSVEDLARWDANFYHARVGGPAAIAEMYRRGRLNNGKSIRYAGGLSWGEHRGLRTVEHDGVHGGYRTTLVRFPDERFSVIVLANLSTVTPNSLAKQVAEVYLEDRIPASTASTPAAPSAPAPAVDAKLLDACAGEYRFGPGFTRKFVRDKDGLALMVSGAPARLVPTGDREFRVTGFEARYVFVADKSGEVSRVLRLDEGEETPGERLRPVTLTAKELERLTGAFLSDELETRYTLSVRDGKLVLTHTTGTATLQPYAGGQFGSELGWIQFRPDRKGFTLSTSRSRNVRFHRTR